MIVPTLEQARDNIESLWTMMTLAMLSNAFLWIAVFHLWNQSRPKK